MKKELLVASALVGSLGLAGVAEAATATWSGNVRNGVTGDDTDGTAAGTYGSVQHSSLSFSVSETTDSGIKISTSFSINDEGANDSGNPAGLTLTFTDGSALDLIEAGNSIGTYIASVPSASGEQGISGSTANSAPTGITFANTSDNVGFEWKSAADFMGVEGLKGGVSAAFGDDGDGSSSSTAETSWSVGLSYVSTAGDTTVTIGGGIVGADDSNAVTANDKASQSAVSATAVTGDLTVGIGWGSGSMIKTTTTVGENVEVDSAEIMTAGAKYVSGDITFAVGWKDGDASDIATFGSNGTNTDSFTSVGASVDYVVAPGVTATLGYSTQDSQDENTSQAANSGSSWYVGANITF
jgi:hypothetical protein